MLLAIAATARLVFAESPASALLATAIAAFNPQVLFMAAMVNNDVMVSLCGAAIALQLTRIAHAPAPRTRAFVALGLALGLSLASKNSALVLLPFVAAALGFIAWRTRWARGATLRHALTTGLATALIAAPHFARNRLVEGKWLLDRTTDAVDTLTTAGVFGAGLNQALIDAWLPRIFINAFRTFWGAFGWGNVQQPEAAYTVFAVLCALAVMGALLGWRRAAPPTRTVLSVLLGLGVAILLLPTYRAIAYQDPALLPGRYLMPALSGYAVLLAFGLQRIFGAKPAATFALAAAAALWAALVPITVIAPRYRAQITAPAKNDAVILRFGDVAEITQVTAETLYLQDREGPRQYARVRLTWRALRATAEPFAAAITVVGFDAEPLGSVVVHPQRGNYPSTIWTPGATFTDEYDVLLQKPCARLPALGRIDVALIATTTDAITGEVRVEERLRATDSAGTAVTPIIGRFKIDAPKLPYPIHWLEPRVRFDGAIGLRDTAVPSTTTPGSALIVTANYDLLTPLARDATVFVHALDAAGALVAQDDHAPFHGDYPSNLWDPGDCAHETFVLNIPQTAQGKLRLVTGWYDAAGRLRATTAFERDPADTRKPRPLADDLAEIGDVFVTR